jgi:hypothetical protein
MPKNQPKFTFLVYYISREWENGKLADRLYGDVIHIDKQAFRAVVGQEAHPNSSEGKNFAYFRIMKYLKTIKFRNVQHMRFVLAAPFNFL